MKLNLQQTSKKLRARAYEEYPQVSNFSFIYSLLANAVGIILLLVVLKTVEWAALRVPLPELRVFFLSGLKEEKIMVKEKRELRIFINNNGEKMAEDVDVFVFFPPDFKVKSMKPYYTVTKQGKLADYPNYNAVVFNYNRIHINTNMFSPKIAVESPEKLDRHKIPICIYERNIGECWHELFLEVVD